MKYKSYSELLKDPRWQKKRLEVFERSNFECDSCGDKKNTLHVHHGYYSKNLKPWEYELNTLHCLCEMCHKETEFNKQAVYKEMANLCDSHLLELLGYIKGLKFMNLLTELSFNSYEEALGFVIALNLPYIASHDIIDSLNNSKIEGWKIAVIKEKYRPEMKMIIDNKLGFNK